MPEDIPILFKDVHDEEISISFVHCRVIFTVVGKSPRAILILEDFVGLRVAKKLLKKTQNPWLVNRVILKDAFNLLPNIGAAVQPPRTGGLQQLRIGSAIRQSKSNGERHFRTRQHSTTMSICFAQTNLNSVDGFVVQHHRHKNQPHGLGIPTFPRCLSEQL